MDPQSTPSFFSSQSDNAPSGAAIRVENLNFRYRRGPVVFENVSFSVNHGEIIAVAGDSGCGKTTLLYILKGIIPHEIKGKLGGTIVIDSNDVKKTSISKLARSVGMVFQDLNAQLFSNTVLEEVQFGLKNFHMDPNLAWEALETLGIKDLADRIPMNLSAGQKQRVILASVLALKPKILLLDEPGVHLDPRSKMKLRDWLKKLNQTTGMTILIASNEPFLIGELCNEILYIKDKTLERKKKTEVMERGECWRWAI